MATPWAEVAAKPEFQALPVEQKEAARNQYFQDVVVPQIPAEKIQDVKLQFDKETGFTNTGGGAAVGNPSIANTRAPRAETPGITNAITAIGGAGAAGVLAPEILTGLAGAAGAFPVTAPAAPFLQGLASGSRIIGRPALAAGAAIAESLGQAAEGVGAPQVVAEGLRLGAGPLVPELVKTAYNIAIKIPTLSIWKAGTKQVVKNIVDRFQSDPKSINEQERELLEKMVGELRGGKPASDQPAKDVYGGLETGAATVTARSQAEAKRILDDAERAARLELETAMRSPDVTRRRAALPVIDEISSNAVKSAQQQRLALGADRELSDVGNEARTAINKVHGDMLAARDAQIKADKLERDKIVNAKESAGQYLEAEPQYQTLLQDLKNSLLQNKQARMSGNLKRVADPATERAYAGILDALSNKRIPVSDAEAAAAEAAGLRVVKGTKKNPETGATEPQMYREFTNSFDALDEVRRKLGTVFTKEPAEGYAAINADIARKYYGQISAIQKNFAGGAGGAQERLLEHYANMSEGLEPFRSKTGKLATAVDKHNDEEFATNAGALPKRYFASREGVNALRELTGGNSKLVEKLGKEYAQNALRVKDAAGVEKWLGTNSDWLATTPEGKAIRPELVKYQMQLARAERIAANSERAKEIIRTSVGDRLKLASTAADALGRRAATDASGIAEAGEKAASRLLTNDSPVNAVKKLILQGGTKEWEAAAEAIHANPTAKAALPDAVRQIYAEELKPQVFFERGTRHFLEKMGLMSSKDADSISRQLYAIQNMKIPEADKVPLMRRLLIQSITGYGASVGGRSVEFVTRLNNQQ